MKVWAVLDEYRIFNSCSFVKNKKLSFNSIIRLNKLIILNSKLLTIRNSRKNILVNIESFTKLF